MLLASGSGPGLQIDFDFTGELSKSCKSKIPGGISLLLWSFGKLIIPINIWVITIPCDQRGGGWGEFPFLWPLYRPLLSGKRFLNLLSLNALKVCMPQRPQNSPVTFYFFPAAWPSSQAGGAGRNRPFSSGPPQSPPRAGVAGELGLQELREQRWVHFPLHLRGSGEGLMGGAGGPHQKR